MPASPKTPQRKTLAGSGPASPISPSPSPRPSPRLASPGSFLKRAVSAGWRRRQDPLEHPLPPGSVSSSDFDTAPSSPRSTNVASPVSPTFRSRHGSPAQSPLSSPSSISFPRSISSSSFLPNASEPDFEMITQASYRPSPRVPSETSSRFMSESPRVPQTESPPSLEPVGMAAASLQTPVRQDLLPPSTNDTPPTVPAMAPKRRESLRRRSSVKQQQGLGIDGLPATSPLTPRRQSLISRGTTPSSSRYVTPEPEELPALTRTDSNSSITEEVMTTVSPVSPVLQTPPLSITPKRQPSVDRGLGRANSVAASIGSNREESVDPLTPIVPPRGAGIRRHSSLKDFDKSPLHTPNVFTSETSPLSINRQPHLRRSSSAYSQSSNSNIDQGYFAPRGDVSSIPGTPTSPGTPLNYSQEMMSKRTPVATQSQRYDSLIPAAVDPISTTAPGTPTPDAMDGWSPMKTQPEVSISRASSQQSINAPTARQHKPTLSVASQRTSQSTLPGPPMSSVWLDDNSDEESKPESRWRGLRRSSKTNSTISTNMSGNSSNQGISHSASFPLLPLRESTTKSDSLRSSSSSNYNDPHSHRLSDRQSTSDKSLSADTEHSSVSSAVPSVGTPKTAYSPQSSYTPKSNTTSPSRLKSPLRRSESGNKWSVNSIFSRSPRHKKSSSIGRPYNLVHVEHKGMDDPMIAQAIASASVPMPDPASPNLAQHSPLQRNKSTSSAHNALKNGLRSVKDRAMGHSPSKSLSGESFDGSFGGPISKIPSNATGYSVHTTHSRSILAEPGITLNTSMPIRPRRTADVVIPPEMLGTNEDEAHTSRPAQARRLSNSSSNYSSNSTVGSTAKSQVGVTAATTPSMSPDGRDARFSSVQSEHAARVANLLKDNTSLNRASPANSPNPNLNAFPAPNLSITHRQSWRFSDADLDIEEEAEMEDEESAINTSPYSSPRIPQRSERRRGSTSYDTNGFMQVPGSAPQAMFNSPRLSQQFESSSQTLQTPQTPSSSSSSNAGFRRKNHGLGLIKNQPSSDSIGSSWTSPGSDFVEQHNWLCQTAPQSDLESAASTPNASQTTFRRSALLPSPLLPQQQQQQQQQSPQSQPYNTNGRHLSTSSLPSHGAILEDLAEENVAHRPAASPEELQTWL